MGLADIVQKAAKTAFKAIGDIPLTCTYTDKGMPVYDPASGTYSSSDTDYTGLKFVFENYEANEVSASGGVILTTDQKASIPNLNLTPTPQIKDLITDSDSVVWVIENIKTDPAKALWIFQVRRSD